MRPAAILAVLLGIAAAFFAIDSIRLRGELSRARAESDATDRREREIAARVAATDARAESLARDLLRLQAEKDRLAAELARGAAASRRTATLDLSAVKAGKDGPIPSVRAAGDVELIRVTVPSAGTGAARATIRAVSGGVVWEGSGTAASGGLSLLVPSRLLGPGDYVLTVESRDTGPLAETYAFRVHR